MERQFTIRSGSWDLSAVLHYPELSADREGEFGQRFPVIVICHGFLGNRIGVDRLFVNAARHFEKFGYMVLRFDYAGCGESAGEYGLAGMDDMIAQTRVILDYATDIDGIDPERVTLLGHSLGGAVALLTSARDRRVSSLVLWAPSAHPLSDIVRIVDRSVYDRAMGEGSADYAGYAFAPRFFDSLASHQPLRETGSYFGDVLLVHGSSDDVIPADYTFLYQKLFRMRQDGQCDKAVLFQADHTFSSSEHRKELFQTTTDWLNNAEQRKRDWNGWMV